VSQLGIRCIITDSGREPGAGGWETDRAPAWDQGAHWPSSHI